jgi:hypothetical protein
LLSEGASDSFQFIFGVFFGVTGNTGLGATEWHISDRAFPGHKSGESFHLIHIDVRRVSHTALGWESVVRVLRSVARENLGRAVVHSHPERGFKNGVAGHHMVKDSVDIIFLLNGGSLHSFMLS